MMYKKVKQSLAQALMVMLLSCNGQQENPAPAAAPEIKDTLKTPVKILNPDAVPDISPMDMVYFPVDYPKLKMTNAISTQPVARVIYSRPHLQGRKLFHNLQQYGEYWRLGANESTEIQFFREVEIQGKKIKAARYILYCIPRQDEWTIYINSNTDTWGLKQDSLKNLQQFSIPVTYQNPHAEYFTMLFEKAEGGANLVMAWDDVLAKLPIRF